MHATRSSKSWGTDPHNEALKRRLTQQRRHSLPHASLKQKSRASRSTTSGALDPTMYEQVVTIKHRRTTMTKSKASRTSQASKVEFDVNKTLDDLKEQMRKLDDEYENL